VEAHSGEPPSKCIGVPPMAWNDGSAEGETENLKTKPKTSRTRQDRWVPDTLRAQWYPPGSRAAAEPRNNGDFVKRHLPACSSGGNVRAPPRKVKISAGS